MTDDFAERVKCWRQGLEIQEFSLQIYRGLNYMIPPVPREIPLDEVSQMRVEPSEFPGVPEAIAANCENIHATIQDTHKDCLGTPPATHGVDLHVVATYSGPKIRPHLSRGGDAVKLASLGDLCKQALELSSKGGTRKDFADLMSTLERARDRLTEQ